MSTSIIPRFNARSLDLVVTGIVDLPTAVHLVEYLEAARHYYRYSRVTLDASYARWRSRAAHHVGAVLRAAQQGGVEVDLRAPEPVRQRRLVGEPPRGGVVRPRRVGFRV